MPLKHTYTLLYFFVLSLYMYPQNSNKKVLFIIADGIPADVIEKISTPNLDAIAKQGGYTRAYVGGEKEGYSETPTISAVGYNSLLTGTWANKHNVWGNSIKDPNYKYWTIFRYAKELRPTLKTAVFSTWLDNRTKLIGEGLEQTANIKMDYHFDGFELDTINFPHDEDRLYIHKIDEHVVNETKRYIKKEGPDLSWVYLEYTDDMGHKFGDSDQFYDSVKILDGQIGQIWDAIDYRMTTFGEPWEIYITTDHGRTEDTGKGHGGQSDRERLTWIITNNNTLNDYYKRHTPAVVDIMPTILRSLDLQPKISQMQEIDGVPLAGPISIAKAKTTAVDNEVQLTWLSFTPNEQVKIWVADTDHFAKGGKDEYRLLGTIAEGIQKFSIPIRDKSNKTCKIVIEGKYNTVNTWFKMK